MRPRWVTRTDSAVVSSGNVALFIQIKRGWWCWPCHVSETKNRESKKTRQGQHTQCHDGDENENVKKAIGWIGKTTSRFFDVFCRSFSTTTWKCLILYFKEDVTKRWRNFLFLNLDMVVMNSTPKNSLALFCKRVGIISIEIERKSAPFLNDVFGTLNSTWATSLFFKFAKIETK